MAVSSQASSIVYQMERSKRYLHAAKEALNNTRREREKARDTIIRCDTEEARLLKVIETNEADAEMYFRRYITAGISWMAIKAVEPKLPEPTPVPPKP